MKCIDPGHYYSLTVLDGKKDETVNLTFVKRNEPQEKYPGNVNNYPGTTVQEVLRACIDRLEYVNWQEKDVNTEAAAELLLQAIWHLEVRAAKKHDRNFPSLYDATYANICKGCGHVGCQGDCGRI